MNRTLARKPILPALAVAILALLGALPPFSPAISAARQADDLTSMTLEQLMSLEVTSVSKRAQKYGSAAAAVFVITQEDIRRSGATSIPDLLRMVPGVQVARIDTNKWAVTARGFNGRFANKLLVLLDGRSVYDPLYSGVYWDTVDTVLEDIERIEVIRGPGASVWGANAVNGVINIITKSARDTQGGLLTAGGGSEERAFGAVRWGGTAGEETAWRAYAKALLRDDSIFGNGSSPNDSEQLNRGGFRMDSPLGDDTELTLIGDITRGSFGGIGFASDTEILAGNLLGRWRKELSRTSELQVQAYYDAASRYDTRPEVARHTFDLDAQQTFALGSRNNLVWGLGYRYTVDKLRGGGADGDVQVLFPDTSKGVNLFSAFLQDEISLIPDTLLLTLGAKLEHNDFTDWEFQPTARLAWTPDEHNTLWAAASRAVRTPSRGERSVEILSPQFPAGTQPTPFGPVPVIAQMRLSGNDDFVSETVWAYEVGYRVSPFENLFVDLAAFYNKYDKLRDLKAQDPLLLGMVGTSMLIERPYLETNDQKATSRGFEAGVEYTPFHAWKLQLAYTFTDVSLSKDVPEEIRAFDAVVVATPKHQVSLRSSLDLPYGLELDVWLRYVAELKDVGVPDYTTLDARLGWKASRNLQFDLVGQNLLHKSHQEFISELIDHRAIEIQRGVYGKVTWRF